MIKFTKENKYWPYTNMPSLLSGVASVIDIGSTYRIFEISLDSQTADYHAIRSDWESVGSDMKVSIENIKKDFIKIGSL